MSSLTEVQHENELEDETSDVTLREESNNAEDDDEDLAIIRRNPETRRSFINRSAYVKLHQSANSQNLRHSVDNLKGRYESIAQENASKPNTLIKPQKSTDENENYNEDLERDDDVEVIRPAKSKESIDKITEELDSFVMDGRPKEKKRSNSFRRLLTGNIFTNKNKKASSQTDDKNKNGETIIYHDNMRNEKQNHDHQNHDQEVHEDKVRELEIQYAEMHVNRFNQIKQTFANQENQVEVPREYKPKRSIADYISTPVNRYIDTSSSTSTESGQNGQNQNFARVRSEVQDRPLPDPYEGTTKISPRTIERNLDNNINSKDYPDKANVRLEETYGTVFDRLDYPKQVVANSRPPPSPKSPSLEGSKLRLPPNREIYDLQPRMKSPIPSNRISTDKIIATELLRRSPTPPRRAEPRAEISDRTKPPMSPRVTQKIVTNVMVHAPKQPLENDNLYYSYPRNTPAPITLRNGQNQSGERQNGPVNYEYYSNPRATTPADLRMSTTMKMSPPPPKEDIRKSVEEYYWKELKKLKEEQDYNLRMMQLRNGFMEEQARLRRSRSLSPSTHRNVRRATSLPRENPNQYVDTTYGRMQQQAIPEERAVVVNQPVYNPPPGNFVRHAPDRRSVDSLQRPIFRRGSLTKQEIYDGQNLNNKRVSFSNSQLPQQAWPTRNGFTQSPPQRRLETTRNSYVEDDVFLPPQDPIYGQRPYPNGYNSQQPLYVNSNLRVPREYYLANVKGGSVQNLPENYGSIARYASNSQLQPSGSVYGSRQSVADSIYGQKQVTVRNKYCDIYGQIHDVPQSGVIMGQLLQQGSPNLPPRQPVQNFVRGSRLTASANDIGIRYQNLMPQPINYDQRPLPPIPPPQQQQQLRVIPVSDTESGSDAGEVRRITQTKPKNKKRGFFGK